MYWNCGDYRQNTRVHVCTQWWKPAVLTPGSQKKRKEKNTGRSFVSRRLQAVPALKRGVQEAWGKQSRRCGAGSSCLGWSGAVTPLRSSVWKQPPGTTAQIDGMFNRSWLGKLEAVGDLLALSWKIDETYSRNLRVMNKLQRTVNHPHSRGGHTRSPVMAGPGF